MPNLHLVTLIAWIVIASAPLAASPVAPLTGVGLNGFAEGRSRGCAFVGKRLYCWGSNREGELGIGGPSLTSIAEWVRRPDAPSGEFAAPTSIAVSHASYCVSDAGAVWCWGKNELGQLGLGDRSLRQSPVRVPGLPGDILQVASAEWATCARSAANGVWCWGNNREGQAGQPPASVDAVQLHAHHVPGLPTGVAMISPSGRHVCALAGGQVFCWGANDVGQLGDGGTTDRATPAAVASLPNGIRSVATYDMHSCAIASDGGVWCWGSNEYGQLGRVSADPRAPEPSPQRVSGLPGPADALQLSYGRSCASVAGQRWCWGETEDRVRSSVPRVVPLPEGAPSNWLQGCFEWNGALQCQNGFGHYPWTEFTARPIPGVVGEIAQLGLGKHFGCALTTAGAVWCWGLNDFGQLGQGNLTTSIAAVRVALPSARALAVGSQFACASTVEGLWCWGRNAAGALGDGSTTDRLLPVRSQFDGGLIAAGGAHMCAWGASDGLRCWGANTAGQAIGSPTSAPALAGARPLGAARVLDLSLGWGHSCATIKLGAGERETRCWGSLPVTGVVGPGAALPGDTQVRLRSMANSACVSDRCFGMSYLPPDRGETRVGALVRLFEGATGGFLLGGRMVCAQGAGTDLRCAGLIGRSCEFELVTGQIGSPGQGLLCVASEEYLTPLERGWVPVIGVPERPRLLAAGEQIACAASGSRIWCWGSIPITWSANPPYSPGLPPTFAPVYRAGAIEPAPSVALPRDPTRNALNLSHSLHRVLET